MVRTKAKKAKGDDAFTKRKQKVGQKKLGPATATRAEVHARTLRVTSSVNNPEEIRDSKQMLPVRQFDEILADAKHYKSGNRNGAFTSLQQHIAQHHFIPTPVQQIRLMAACMEHQCDEESGVRKSALSLLQILCRRGYLSHSSTNLVPYMLVALTHADASIRQHSLSVIRTVSREYQNFLQVGEGLQSSAVETFMSQLVIVSKGSPQGAIDTINAVLERVLISGDEGCYLNSKLISVEYMVSFAKELLPRWFSQWGHLMNERHFMRDVNTASTAQHVSSAIARLVGFLFTQESLPGSIARSLHTMLQSLPCSADTLLKHEQLQLIAANLGFALVPIYHRIRDAQAFLHGLFQIVFDANSTKMEVRQQFLLLFSTLLALSGDSMDGWWLELLPHIAQLFEHEIVNMEAQNLQPILSVYKRLLARTNHEDTWAVLGNWPKIIFLMRRSVDRMVQHGVIQLLWSEVVKHCETIPVELRESLVCVLTNEETAPKGQALEEMVSAILAYLSPADYLPLEGQQWLEYES